MCGEDVIEERNSPILQLQEIRRNSNDSEGGSHTAEIPTVNSTRENSIEVENHGGISFKAANDLYHFMRLSTFGEYAPGPVIETGRTFYMSRHGESEYNVDNRLGGDPPLTEKGRAYAEVLGEYLNNLELPNLKIWRSSLQRTHMTAAHIKGEHSSTELLDEIRSGTMDNLTYQEFKKNYPDQWRAREADKLGYRYPKGESYIDACERIEPIMLDLEKMMAKKKDDNLIIVAHQAILRCFLGYLLQRKPNEIPFIQIPQHAILKLIYEGPDVKWSAEVIWFPEFHPGIEIAPSKLNEIKLSSSTSSVVDQISRRQSLAQPSFDERRLSVVKTRFGEIEQSSSTSSVLSSNGQNGLRNDSKRTSIVGGQIEERFEPACNQP